MSDKPRSKSNTEIHFSDACERPIVSIEDRLNGSEHNKPDKKYTKKDIGNQVTLNIDGVVLNDVVVEVALPGRGSIIGPTFVCAHIFARLTMMEAMMAASAHASKERDDWSDEMA